MHACCQIGLHVLPDCFFGFIYASEVSRNWCFTNRLDSRCSFRSLGVFLPSAPQVTDKNSGFRLDSWFTVDVNDFPATSLVAGNISKDIDAVPDSALRS